VIQKGLLFSLNFIRKEKLTGITSVRVVIGLLGVWRSKLNCSGESNFATTLNL